MRPQLSSVSKNQHVLSGAGKQAEQLFLEQILQNNILKKKKTHIQEAKQSRYESHVFIFTTCMKILHTTSEYVCTHMCVQVDGP